MLNSTIIFWTEASVTLRHHLVVCVYNPEQTEWTHGSQYAQHLSQSLRYVVNGAEHQGADHNVHRLVLYCSHVLPRCYHEPFICEVVVFAHAALQVTLETGVRISANHPAACWKVFKIGARAAANLKKCELFASRLKLWDAAKQLSLLVLHFVVIRFHHTKQTSGVHKSVESIQTDRVHQVERQT